MLHEALAGLYTKPVDYTCRGVMVPDGSLATEQIGLPLRTAIVLYEPWMVRILRQAGRADSVPDALHLLSHSSPTEPLITAALSAAIGQRPLLAIADNCRAAALTPVVVAGESLRIHPQHGRELGLAFAGDQVTLHVPLTQASISELRCPTPSAEGEAHASMLDWTPSRLSAAALGHSPLPLSLFDRIALGIAPDLDGSPVPEPRSNVT